MRRPARLIPLVFATIVAAATVGVAPSTPVLAASYTLHVQSPVVGGIGLGGVYSPPEGIGYDIPPCALSGPTLRWDQGGNLVGPTTIPDRKTGPLVNVRFELYPGTCEVGYDAWANVGGVHFDTAPATARNLGTVVTPVDGVGGAFRVGGPILSSSPVGTDRVLVEAFQIEGLKSNGIVSYGAFGVANNRGTTWTAGVGWAGRYMMYITDHATGNKIGAVVDVVPGNTVIDLDAICFGFDTCNYFSGGPTTTAGTFHSTAPTRILDTRTATGITNGPIRTGDGRNPSPNPDVRADETANHDLQVTGVAGIPTSGVSAVLLNVTATGGGAPGPGFLSVIPKPARVGDVFNDQGSYGAFPNTSNLNFDTGDPTPNLVLARVGAGGKIRLYNYVGPTNVIADVAGWFGTGGAHTDGSGFTGVVPSRLLDSRLGIGTAARQFAPGETRNIRVAGVAGIPTNAESVVVNVTMVGSPGSGYLTAYPTGGGLPNASNVNILPGGVRANTSVVKVGTGGQISLFVAETSSDVIVDVLGSYGPGGGRVTTITPERFGDSRSSAPYGENEVRNTQIAGRGSVPANATAVIANVTAVDPTAWGFLSVWPAAAAKPTASNLNFLPGQTVPNLVMMKLGAGGAISIANGPGASHVLIDVMGYVV